MGKTVKVGRGRMPLSADPTPEPELVAETEEDPDAELRAQAQTEEEKYAELLRLAQTPLT